MTKPIPAREDLRFESFSNNKVLSCKKNGKLPVMGWNSWNAFGSGNTEGLTKQMAEKLVELGLDKLGYKYVVLDDGCYLPHRVDGKLSNEPEKFPDGFKALADFLHSKGLKFGMYNDIGEKLCAGSEVGTYGYEKVYAKQYLDWEIDFIKIDNCYNIFDNATFADPENARFTFGPNIKSVFIGDDRLSAEELTITGECAKVNDSCVTFLGTLDGTGPDYSPVGMKSSEIVIEIESGEDKTVDLKIDYATGKEEGVGAWLQIDVNGQRIFDDLLPETASTTDFTVSSPFAVQLKTGKNTIKLMNHRRQENTLSSYAAMMEAFEEIDKDNDVILSVCEWGKTNPQNWAYKVGNSWRILNDITFAVGSAEGDYGTCAWEGDYTTNITTQYNKAVIMDEFAGLDKGWNDPDMMVIGMNGLDQTMNESHMAMWCMLNSPLMLGLDLRRITKGDEIYNIIANEDYIALNQDALGVQAKRIFTTINTSDPSKDYIRDNKRIDVLVKPLSDGSIAVGFFNLDTEDRSDDICITFDEIAGKMNIPSELLGSDEYQIKDLKTKETWNTCEKRIRISSIKGCASYLVKITPV
ncbi:MAG: alpha-galactosidase [Clostridia bacterium]|nr:alpha-galactosidase [Clostridia bacterium]